MGSVETWGGCPRLPGSTVVTSSRASLQASSLVVGHLPCSVGCNQRVSPEQCGSVLWGAINGCRLSNAGAFGGWVSPEQCGSEQG